MESISKYVTEPVYYAVRDGKSLEGRTIAEIVGKPAVDLYALREYFTFQNILSERTLFQGVSIVSPGWEIHTNNTLLHCWDFNLEVDTTLKYKDCVEELRVLLRRAVQRLTWSTPGGLLSGGLDSSTIAAFAPKDYRTFTIGFKSYDKFDESKLATKVAKRLGLQNYQEILDSSDMPALLDDVTKALEELRISILYPDYAAYELAAKHASIILTGTGGDELFAGYPWKYKASNQEYLEMVQRLVPERDHSQFFSEHVMKETRGFSPLEEFNKRYPYDTLYDRFYYDLKVDLFGQLIVNDKLARRHNLKVQYPFLDEELVQFALSLPAEFKYHNGVGKRILRDAMKGLLPGEIIRRPKQGFYPPDEHWYRKENAAFVGNKLNALSKTGFFKPEYILRIYREHMNGTNHTRLLWSLMSFESWLRLNKITAYA